MSSTTICARAFHQDAGGAKLAALDGPVFIADRGRPSHVLLSIEAYERLTGSEPNLVDVLAAPGSAAIDVDPSRLASTGRPVDLD